MSSSDPIYSLQNAYKGWPDWQDVYGLIPKQLMPRTALAVECAHWGVGHKDLIHYLEARPIPLERPHHWPRLPLATDCSGWVTICFRYAGAPDPNGQGYDGEGYTGTLLSHLPHIPLGKLRRGDLVVYGCRSIPAGHHVGLVARIDAFRPDKIVTISHGSEAGPLPITVAAEAAGQPDGLAGVIYLRGVWK